MNVIFSDITVRNKVFLMDGFQYLSHSNEMKRGVLKFPITF
ncbi:hypothetical protein MEG_01051 [Bartonella tamiae Th307]|uniref:Uncharacterized protein n=1 Tax=Bartonella tamiae Th239 TaxID=1094558 RepID=J0R482_9HYPH|nr:hypothetical protein ME5_00830 [Bartonella tamiae Th239]EJF93627.1 hypothetical protein MEG_01051 [Bartonella tamiae Th307]